MKPKPGDYVFLNNLWYRIDRVSTTGPVILHISGYADHYYHEWMKILPKSVYESKLYKALK